jgi:hypothetical protein
MSNPLRGEVSFKSGDQDYVLVFTIDALISLEEAFDCSVQDLGDRLGEGVRMKDLRTVFHAGLQAHHPNMSEADASRVMSEIGLTEASDLFRRAFLGAFASGKEAKAGERPQRARGGTGATVSTSGLSSDLEAKPALDA